MPAATAARPDEPISAPLGLAYLAANLVRHHHQVTILDAATLSPPQNRPDGRWRIGLDAEDLAELTAKSNPDLIGISCPFTTRYGPFKRLISALKQRLPSIPLVGGGIHPSIFPVDVLNENDLDCVVVGEGETTLTELANRLEQNGKLDPEGLDGVAYIKDGKPLFRPRKTYVKNLDDLPDPARHLLDIEAYLNRSGGRWTSRHKTVLSVLTSRSCPGRCSFCSIHAVFGPHWRARSAERVIAEVDFVTQRYKPSLIAFEDDRLTVDRERLVKICEGLASFPRRVNWYTPNGVHVADFDEELLRIMRDSGCRTLNLAIESGDPEMLQKTIGKKANQEQARQTAEYCRQIGIRTNGYFVVGMPGETDQSLERSLKFCLSLPLDGLGVFIATPFPGTRMYDECVEKGYISPQRLLQTYYEAADADLLHEPLFETPTMSRERLVWWSNRFKTEFQQGLYRRRPELRLKDAVKKIISLAGYR